MSEQKPTPDQAAFWPKKMSRDSCEATAEQMAEAWKVWTKNGQAKDLMYMALPSKLRQAGAKEGPVDYPLHSVADGMTQRARKAGFLTWDNRRWQLTTPEA